MFSETGEHVVERGTTVGRFVILDRLGEGGTGAVYAAFDPELDRKIALKLIRLAEMTDVNESQGRTLLMREAQALARLSHPNVVAVYDVGTFEGNVFIAEELVDGWDFRTWMHQKPRSTRHAAPVAGSS